VVRTPSGGFPAIAGKHHCRQKAEKQGIHRTLEKTKQTQEDLGDKTVDQEVGGSSPPSCTSKIKDFIN
jgi:hypothetical protein